MTPEGKVKQELKAYLASLGEHCWWVMPMSFGYGKVGVPDFIICYRGFFFAPETKKLGGKSEPWQITQQAQIRAAGGKSERVTDVETVKEWVAEIDTLIRNIALSA